MNCTPLMDEVCFAVLPLLTRLLPLRFRGELAVSFSVSSALNQLHFIRPASDRIWPRTEIPNATTNRVYVERKQDRRRLHINTS